jgi:hypothetical protein
MIQDRGKWLKPIVQLARKHVWLPALVCALGIITVSSIPRLGVRTPLFPGCDKVLHFIEYSIFGAALRFWSGGGRMRFLAGGTGFAALDEFHQRYIPGREANPWDFAADAAGLLFGFMVSRRFIRRG